MYLSTASEQQQSRKRGYDDYANNFFEDAKRSRIEPIYNPAMAQRLSGLNPYVNDAWLYDQSFGSGTASAATAPTTISLPALKTKQDLLEIDQWLYQLSGTVQQSMYSTPNDGVDSYATSPGSMYPSMTSAYQNNYSQSLHMAPSANIYPNLPATTTFNFSNQLGSYPSSILPQLGSRYTDQGRSIDISRLQAAPSSARESNVRGSPVVPAAPVVASPTAVSELRSKVDGSAQASKENEITKDVEKMSLMEHQGKQPTEAQRKKHAEMIHKLRSTISVMLRKLEGEVISSKGTDIVHSGPPVTIAEQQAVLAN